MKETIIRQPITVGDTVYHVWREFDLHGRPDIYHITKTTVIDMSVVNGITLSYEGDGRASLLRMHPWEELDAEIFLTRDEAIVAVESEYGYAGRFQYEEKIII